MKKLSLAIVLVLLLCAVARAEPLVVASGAGYKKLVTELAAAYEQKSGQKLELVFGNMGQVVAQAKGSGMVRVIVGEKGFLEKSGLSIAGFAELGHGVLVLAWPKAGHSLTLADLAKPEVRRIAMPDAQKAIYGKAGSEALAKAGLADKVKEKLLVVATVPQVTSYLVLGEVDAGFANLTDIMGVAGQLGGYVKVDPALYAPIAIGAAVLEAGKDDPAVRAFTAFLASPQARDIARRHGL